MADKVLDPNNLAAPVVEFWASSVDALLQAFKEAVAAGDRMGIVLAGARIAQLAGNMSDWFRDGTVALIVSPKEKGEAQAVCSQVNQMVQGRMDRIYGRQTNEGKALTSGPNRGAN